MEPRAGLHLLTRRRRLRAPTWIRAGTGRALLLAAVAAPWWPAGAVVFLSQDEALELAFPGCEIERRTVFLTGAQKDRIKSLAGFEPSTAIVYPYRATCEGQPAGAAYFDTHKVRTAAEILMVAVAADGSVARVEILRFDEPQQYIPRRGWYDQFLGRRLSPELQLDRGIRNVTGATLTARATAKAVRLALALHRVLSDDADESTASAPPAAGVEATPPSPAGAPKPP